MYTLHQQSVVDCISAAVNRFNYVLSAAKSVSCFLNSPLHTYVHTYINNTKYVTEVINILTKLYDIQHSAVLNCHSSHLDTAQPTQLVLQYIPLLQQSTALHHLSKSVFTKRYMCFKDEPFQNKNTKPSQIRSQSGSRFAMKLLCTELGQAQILIDFCIFSLVVPRNSCIVAQIYGFN